MSSQQAKSCSIARHKKGNFTCMTDEEIDLIYLRVFHIKPVGMSKKDKWQQLQKYFGPKCEDREYCWWREIAKGPSDQACAIIGKAYVPEGPYNSSKWWSGLEIDILFKQYEDKYPDFLWLEVHPIDFTITANILYYGTPGKIRETDLLEAYRDGKRRMAAILNLDKHTGPGTHWVGVMIDLTKAGTRTDPFLFLYFDSVSNGPRRRVPAEVLEWVNNLCINSILRLGKHMTFMYNGTPHQKANNECGSYACYFVHQMLAGVPFERHCLDIKTDAEIKKVRQVFLRPKA